MIQIYKLDRLPRMQKLRKIAKYFMMAERRLSESNRIDIFTNSELEFFYEATKLLAKDEQFSEEERKLFAEAYITFEQYVSSNYETPTSSFLLPTFHRALNNVKHLLLTVTGSNQADWDFVISNGKLDTRQRKVFMGMQVYLEDIRSPFNVGAMFRTAESFGVEKIILSPFCADPHHRRAERTAMGCIDIIPWERQELFAPDHLQLNNHLQANNHFLASGQAVFALETGGVPINEFSFPARGILIAGSEELGVSPRALEAADASLGRVSIPIYGAKASLNVSTAFGIALQYWASKLINES